MLKLKSLLFIFLFCWGALPALAESPPPPLRVLMMVNEGFWAPEYYLPRQAFDRAGFRVTVAAKAAGLVNPDKRNTDVAPVEAELGFEQVNPGDYDAIAFAGGNGAWTDYFPNDRVHELLAAFLGSGKPTGLLCSSTGLLGVARNYNGQGKPLAAGRHVTGYYRVEGLLRELGKVNYDGGDPKLPYVVIDGNLITGRDPMSAQMFGDTMVRVLKQLPR